MSNQLRQNLSLLIISRCQLSDIKKLIKKKSLETNKPYNEGNHLGVV
jgi:hypothetical protein